MPERPRMVDMGKKLLPMWSGAEVQAILLGSFRLREFSLEYQRDGNKMYEWVSWERGIPKHRYSEGGTELYANNCRLPYKPFLYCNILSHKRLSYCPGTFLFLGFSDCPLDHSSAHWVRSVLASRNVMQVWDVADPRHELEHPNSITQEFLV